MCDRLLATPAGRRTFGFVEVQAGYASGNGETRRRIVEQAHIDRKSAALRTAFRPPPRHQLELRVDADPFWMSALRALITDLAIRADFDLDAVADLTLAVDEACAALIEAAGPQDTLVCQFAVAVDRITVTACLPTGWRVHRPVRTDTFGWRVIRTLADEVELLDNDGSLGIRLTKWETGASG